MQAAHRQAQRRRQLGLPAWYASLKPPAGRATTDACAEEAGPGAGAEGVAGAVAEARSCRGTCRNQRPRLLRPKERLRRGQRQRLLCRNQNMDSVAGGVAPSQGASNAYEQLGYVSSGSVQVTSTIALHSPLCLCVC